MVSSIAARPSSEHEHLGHDRSPGHADRGEQQGERGRAEHRPVDEEDLPVQRQLSVDRHAVSLTHRARARPRWTATAGDGGRPHSAGARPTKTRSDETEREDAVVRTRSPRPSAARTRTRCPGSAASSCSSPLTSSLAVVPSGQRRVVTRGDGSAGSSSRGSRGGSRSSSGVELVLSTAPRDAGRRPRDDHRRASPSWCWSRPASRILPPAGGAGGTPIRGRPRSGPPRTEVRALVVTAAGRRAAARPTRGGAAAPGRSARRARARSASRSSASRWSRSTSR